MNKFYFLKLNFTIMKIAKKINLLLLFVASFSYGQKNNRELSNLLTKSGEAVLVQKSSSMMVQGYFTYAEEMVDKLLVMNPSSANYNYRKGLLLMEMYEDYQNAIPYLEKAEKNVRKNYDLFSVKEKSSFFDVHYHLARAYHLNHDFDKAINQYNLFKSYLKPKNIFFPIAEKCIKQCELAKEVLNNPQAINIERLSSVINTSHPEYSPVISADGKTMYFTSRRAWDETMSEDLKDHTKNLYPEDIYIATMDEDGNWSAPKRMDFCSKDKNEASLALSNNDNSLVIYKDKEGMGDVYFLSLEGNSNNVNKITTKGVNTKFWESHLMVTADNKTYYFVSDRPGGLGRRDIYSISQDDKGNWSKPQNLGPKINSPFEEEAPFISADGKRLYFASNSEKSIGGFDLFVSEWIDGEGWGEAKNMGAPINSCADDVFFTMTADNGTAYFSSARAEGMGEKDIYAIHYILRDKKPGQPEELSETIYTLPEVAANENVILNFKYHFDYNINKLKTNKGELHRFLKDVESQIDGGKELVTINVYSSASKVPTTKFKDNDELSVSRAENVKYDIMSYFQKKPKYLEKVNVVIHSSVVDGPQYEEDKKNKEKYKPYQFISLRAE
jgi:hypothetical protein